MIDKLLCPFCQQELKPQTMDGGWLECWNCSYYEPSHYPFPQRILCGTKELWQELIRTRKALETLQEFITKLYLNGNITDEQLERYKKMLITALEQKDVK